MGMSWDFASFSRFRYSPALAHTNFKEFISFMFVITILSITSSLNLDTKA